MDDCGEALFGNVKIRQKQSATRQEQTHTLSRIKEKSNLVWDLDESAIKGQGTGPIHRPSPLQHFRISYGASRSVKKRLENWNSVTQ